MELHATDKERTDARHPHELFLINLIFNHILLFAAALGAASSYPLIILPIPLFSIGTLTYTLWRANKSLQVDTWFVKCHWQIAARRSRAFLVLVGAVVAIVAAIMLLTQGHPRPQHWALLGAVILPTMVTILVLIIMETESLQQARHARLPEWVMKRYPPNATENSPS